MYAWQIKDPCTYSERKSGVVRALYVQWKKKKKRHVIIVQALATRRCRYIAVPVQKFSFLPFSFCLLFRSGLQEKRLLHIELARCAYCQRQELHQMAKSLVSFCNQLIRCHRSIYLTLVFFICFLLTYRRPMGTLLTFHSSSSGSTISIFNTFPHFSLPHLEASHVTNVYIVSFPVSNVAFCTLFTQRRNNLQALQKWFFDTKKFGKVALMI